LLSSSEARVVYGPENLFATLDCLLIDRVCLSNAVDLVQQGSAILPEPMGADKNLLDCACIRPREITQARDSVDLYAEPTQMFRCSPLKVVRDPYILNIAGFVYRLVHNVPPSVDTLCFAGLQLPTTSAGLTPAGLSGG